MIVDLARALHKGPEKDRGNNIGKLSILASKDTEDLKGSLITKQLSTTPLVVLIHASSKETSDNATASLCDMISASDNIRDSLLQTGFIDTFLYTVQSEPAPEPYIKKNLLQIIQRTLETGADPNFMADIVDELEVIKVESQAKPEDKIEKEVAIKAEKILDILLNGPRPLRQRLRYRRHARHVVRGSDGKPQIIEDEVPNPEIQKELMTVKGNLQNLESRMKSLEIETEELRKESGNLKDNKAFRIVIPDPDVVRLDGEKRVTALQKGPRLIPFTPLVADGQIVKLDLKFARRTSSVGIGVVNGDVNITGSYCIWDSINQKNNIIYWNGGVVEHGGKYTSGNTPYQNMQVLSMEVNMRTTPRTLHFFVDEAEQPVHIEDLPETIAIFGYLYDKTDCFVFVEAKRLEEPTAQGSEDAIVVKWIK
ncbi:MAG: hypothetical protein EZS28_008653 [Streblomastix strix]|uniref:Uncharacterized protein n=1 Tax=Streblomastix strix TaxID=222440 RepID=A0A5J4WMG2_9EUKA|nr:MAG: hypothetical protein EZS28_008653 [Streblomastix strix]